MPRVTLPQLPLSALFGVSKPSGPSSMAILDDLKRLFSASRLFVDHKSAALSGEVIYAESGDSTKSVYEKKWGRGLPRKGRKKNHAPSAKVGQGGTLDPLADGVLVIGVNKGTKELSGFLDCVKEYRTTCLLGCETDTYDSEGVQVREAPWRHVTRDKVEAALKQFRGEIQQTPPIFSALKMNGKPLYEYARSGTPLPRPIERRTVTVYSLELTRWIPGATHSFRFPEKKFTDEEREKMQSALRGVEIPVDAVIKNEPESNLTDAGSGSGTTITAQFDLGSLNEQGNRIERADSAEEGHVASGPPAFVLSMRVSSGTYVRSIVHDLGLALGSAAHVVTLTRSRQGRYTLPTDASVQTPAGPSSVSPSSTVIERSLSDDTDATQEKALEREDQDRVCISWEVFARGLENGAKEEPDAEGWREWEREVMARMEIIEPRSNA